MQPAHPEAPADTHPAAPAPHPVSANGGGGGARCVGEAGAGSRRSTPLASLPTPAPHPSRTPSQPHASYSRPTIVKPMLAPPPPFARRNPRFAASRDISGAGPKASTACTHAHLGRRSRIRGCRPSRPRRSWPLPRESGEGRAVSGVWAHGAYAPCLSSLQNRRRSRGAACPLHPPTHTSAAVMAPPVALCPASRSGCGPVPGSIVPTYFRVRLDFWNFLAQLFL